MDGRQVIGAALQPGHRRPLWVKVHDGGLWAATCVTGRNVCGESRLAATPFGVEDDDLIQVVS